MNSSFARRNLSGVTGLGWLEAGEAHVQKQDDTAPVQAQTQTPYERPADDRFNFCFIMGTKGAYKIADSFANAYYSGSHEINHASSLCGLLEVIQNAVEFKVTHETRSRLGQVVIISHASKDVTLFFPLNAGDTKKWLKPEDISNLLSSDWLERTTLSCRFASQSVARSSDGQTRVIVKGCNLGQNQAAIDALRQLFGGQPTVTAPKKQVRMETLGYGHGESGRRTPVEVVSWMVKNGYRQPEAEQWEDTKKTGFVLALFSKNAETLGIPADYLVLEKKTKVLPSDPRYRENIARSEPGAGPMP